MALGSQVSKVDTMAGSTGLTHDVFVGKVLNNVRRASKTAALFEDAGPGQYRLEGQHLVGATDLLFANGAMATSGYKPDHTSVDAVQWQIVPCRRYRRIAKDNMVVRQASGPGAFDNLADRLFDQLWDSWASMTIRHAIGSSNGYLAVISSRTSSTVVVLKDGYGHVGTNPVQHLSKGTTLAWLDATAAYAAAGAGVMTADPNFSTNAITVTSAATWEPSATTAAGDIIVMATTGNIATDYFDTESANAPNGIGNIVDPDANASTVMNIIEGTYARWKPFRKASGTFDHIEVSEHWTQLGVKRGFAVTPQEDVAIAHPAVTAQLARTLLGFQQQQNLGEILKGGYADVEINGMGFIKDPFFYHNVMVTLNRPSLFRVTLGGEADMNTEGGGEFAPLADFDGVEGFASEYMQQFSVNRGANGALTGIATADETTADYDAVPNY